MKRRKPVVLGAVLAALVLAPHPIVAARAAEADTLSLSYAIFVSGARIYGINYSASMTSDAYTSAVSMAPKGLGTLFADFKLEMQSSGTLADGKPHPVDFSMESTKDKERKKLSMSWSGKDLPRAKRSFKIPGPRAAAVEGVLKPGMPDPLTAILRHSLAASEPPCTRKLRSYNGAEVYDLVLTYLGEETLEKEKNGGAYTGPAIKCKVVFVPIAGYPEKKMRKHLANPPTYMVWLAKFASPTTSTRILLPIRAMGKAAGRSFKIVASDATMSGRPLAALSALGK